MVSGEPQTQDAARPGWHRRGKRTRHERCARPPRSCGPPPNRQQLLPDRLGHRLPHPASEPVAGTDLRHRLGDPLLTARLVVAPPALFVPPQREAGLTQQHIPGCGAHRLLRPRRGCAAVRAHPRRLPGGNHMHHRGSGHHRAPRRGPRRRPAPTGRSRDAGRCARQVPPAPVRHNPRGGHHSRFRLLFAQLRDDHVVAVQIITTRRTPTTTGSGALPTVALRPGPGLTGRATIQSQHITSTDVPHFSPEISGHLGVGLGVVGGG